MKKRNCFVSNSSSTSFLITNNSDRKLNIINLFSELSKDDLFSKKDVDDYLNEGSTISQTILMSIGELEFIEFEPDIERIINYDSDGPVLGTVMTNLFNSNRELFETGFETKSFIIKGRILD